MTENKTKDENKKKQQDDKLAERAAALKANLMRRKEK
jgi:hypothetical protein